MMRQNYPGAQILQDLSAPGRTRVHSRITAHMGIGMGIGIGIG